VRDDGITEGVLFYNNKQGSSGFCLNMTETLLPENSKLTVVPPEGAVPVKKGATGDVKTFNGNDKTQKKPHHYFFCFGRNLSNNIIYSKNVYR